MTIYWVESLLEITKYVLVGGCKDVWQEWVLRMDGGDERWAKEAGHGAGQQQSDFGNFAQVFLTFFTSFENPSDISFTASSCLCHSQDDSGAWSFSGSGQCIGAETMGPHGPLEPMSHTQEDGYILLDILLWRKKQNVRKDIRINKPTHL